MEKLNELLKSLSSKVGNKFQRDTSNKYSKQGKEVEIIGICVITKSNNEVKDIWLKSNNFDEYDFVDGYKNSDEPLTD